MFTSKQVYALGYKDAHNGRVYRDSIPINSRFRNKYDLDSYEKGWNDARNHIKPIH